MQSPEEPEAAAAEEAEAEEVSFGSFHSLHASKQAPSTKQGASFPASVRTHPPPIFFSSVARGRIIMGRTVSCVAAPSVCLSDCGRWSGGHASGSHRHTQLTLPSTISALREDF